MKNAMSTAGKRSISRTSNAISRAVREVNAGSFSDIRLPANVQKLRVARVIENELTEKQRSCVVRVFQGQTLTEISKADGVSLSTTSRTFHRGMKRLRRFLRY